MECPYCGNDDPSELIYPDQYSRAFMTCLNCDGDFEAEEIEYYENQSEDEESEEDDKLLSLSAIIQALENEIKWSRDNTLLAPDEEAADWFIKGLEQAKWLILEVSKNDYQEPLAVPDASKKKSSQVDFTFGEGGNLENMTDENHGCPGWMGDYGATPFGPVDV